MKRAIDFRYWFSEHILAAALIFALFYQLVDIFLNYFVSGELRQGFSNFYQSTGGKEDLLRFVLMSLLFSCFGVFSRNIILENRKAREDLASRLNEVKHFAHAVIHDVKNPAIGILILTTAKKGNAT